MFYIPTQMPLALIFSIPLAIAAAIALIAGGAFVGAQIDDKIEHMTDPLPSAIKNVPYYITIPVIIVLSFFGVKVAKKWSKKL